VDALDDAFLDDDVLDVNDEGMESLESLEDYEDDEDDMLESNLDHEY
jgi:hypothetical protein